MDVNENPKRVWIKPKIIIGFILVLAMAIGAILVTYKGFVELSKTRLTLSGPSQKLIKLNSILADIYEAESNIRTYTLTQDENYLTLYFSFLMSINEKVDTLLILAYDDAVQSGKIMFVQELLTRKKRVLSDLVELKKTDQYSQFYSMALSEVEKIEIDTTQKASVITSTTKTVRSQHDTIISRHEVETPQGMFNKMKRWFAKKESTDTTITKLLVEVETKVDTLKRAVTASSDSLLNEVVKILNIIKLQQQEAIYNVSAKELEILQSDKQIMDQIRTIVSLLEKEELLNSYNLARDAREVVKRSTTSLLALGGAALFMVLLFTFLIFRDISTSNYFRNKLLESKRYAEKLLKIKEEFLSNMSHEIRTPLSAVIGFSRQLKRTELNQSQELYVKSLESSSQHLLQIVNDILDLSKIEGGYLQFERIAFSPYDIAHDAIDIFTTKAWEKDISIHYYYGFDPPVHVMGDPFRLKQILFNLLSNAIKFTHEGGVILLVNHDKANDENLSFTFEVTDTGIGIEPEKLDTIFEQFSQVDSSTTRMYGGTGLGLTIVKKLTELQGGRIWVASQLNKGTTFTVQIEYPICTEKELAEPPPSIEPQKTLPRWLKILVVDDDSVSRLLTSEMFNYFNINIETTGSPIDALEWVSKTHFNIVFTDIQMPGMSGFDLVKSIRNQLGERSPKIIALTANSTVDQPNYYRDLGFDGVIIKPFDEIALYNAVAPFVHLSPIEIKEEVQERETNEETSDYDASNIIRFASGDKESAKQILQSFIDNFNVNYATLSKMAKENDWEGVSNVSHKMKSAFRQLNVLEVASILEEIEMTAPNGVNSMNITDSIGVVKCEVERVTDLLQLEIEKL